LVSSDSLVENEVFVYHRQNNNYIWKEKKTI